MPAASGAMVFRNPLVTIDDVEYANQVRKARFVPTQNIQTYKTLVPDGAQQDVDSPTWVLELEGLQINAAGGLAKALRDAAGTQLDVTVQIEAGFSKPKADATIVALHVPFGGEEGVYLDFDITLPVSGVPTFGTSAAS